VSPDPSPARPTDGFSIAALVTGIACTGPVAFTLGAIGLHRTGSRRTGGRGLAVAGLVLGAAQMALGGVAAASIGVGAATAALTERTVAIDDLAVGDCFATGADGGLEGTVERTDCADRHDGELLTVVDLGSGEYPGAGYLEGYADQTCADDAAAAVDRAGLDPDVFEYGYYYPLAQNWSAGSHVLQCTIHGWDADLTGSVLDGDAQVIR
jgi:hypothetical protein